MKHRRQALVSYAKSGNVDMFDLKIALALSCQRARNMGYDAEDSRWESLMEQMAACDFEDEETGNEKLAVAINERLPNPVPMEMPEYGETYVGAVVAEALDHLGFIEKGM